MTIKQISNGIKLFGCIVLFLAIGGCNDDSSSSSSGSDSKQETLHIEPSANVTTVSGSKQETLHVESSANVATVGYASSFKAYLVSEDEEKSDVTEQVAWSSSDVHIASIDKKGVATGKSAGECEIKAVLQDKEATASLTVKSLLPKDITLFPLDKTIYLDEVLQYRATGFYPDNTEEDVTYAVDWTSSNPEIVSISNKGNEKGFAKSTGKGAALTEVVTITAVEPNSQKQNKTSLTVKMARLEKFEILPDALTIVLETSKPLQALATFDDNDSKKDVSKSAQWESNKPSTAKVDNKGLVTALKQGDATINATFESQTQSAKVTVVKKEMSGIRISPQNTSIPVGTQRDYTATVIYTDKTDDEITDNVKWSVGEEGAASINDQGRVSGIKKGDTKIFAEYKGNKDEALLAVTDAVLKELTIIPEDKEANFVVGLKKPLNVEGIYSDGERAVLTKQVIWESKSPEILIVDPSGDNAGLAEAKSAGTAEIKVIFFNPETTASMTYTVKDAELLSISISPKDKKIPTKNDILFTATGHYTGDIENELREDVIWASNQKIVAEISQQGLAKANSKGEATIEARYKDKQATTNLTIIDGEAIREIVITPNDATMKPTAVIWFKAKAVFNDETELDITQTGWWESSNIFLVNIYQVWPSWGRAYALGVQGTVEISMTYKGEKGSVKLTVKP